MAEPETAKPKSVVDTRGGHSGLFGASTATVDPHKVSTSKALDYR